MKYYKKIKIQFYEEIVLNSLNFIKLYPKIFYRQNINASFYELNFINYIKQVPMINDAFLDFNLRCIKAAVYVMYNNTHTSIHKDGDYPQARINIPLLNCKDSFTNFYSNCKLERWVNPDSGVISYRNLIQNYNLIDKVEIDQPTVLRISQPHNVEMNENYSPRICLTLTFDKDPVFLLKC